MDSIKEAFVKVKQDILLLQQEIFFVKRDITELKDLMEELILISKQSLEKKEDKVEYSENGPKESPTPETEIPTDDSSFPTEKGGLKSLKNQKQGISTGNDGVPTDRQTNQQTNQQTDFTLIPTHNSENREKQTLMEVQDPFKEAAGMLESLDTIKKELRLKFKRLTDQEILVFSSLYQIEEEKGYADYKTISIKLNLTESSIRDYIGKLIKKGIPVDKIKINNKSIQLKVSPSLKKIASLSTILTLRDI